MYQWSDIPQTEARTPGAMLETRCPVVGGSAWLSTDTEPLLELSTYAMGAVATLWSAGDLLNTIPRTVRCPMNTCDIVRCAAR